MYHRGLNLLVVCLLVLVNRGRSHMLILFLPYFFINVLSQLRELSHLLRIVEMRDSLPLLHNTH